MSNGIYFRAEEDTLANPCVIEDGKKLPLFTPDSPIAKRCLALARIETELTQAILLAKMIDAEQQAHVNLAFWQSAIMSYARCFSKAWGRGTTLETEHVDRAGSTFLPVHDRIMELRNQYIAHAGDHTEEIDRIVVSLTRDPTPQAVNSTHYFLMSRMGPKTESRDSLVDLCCALI